MRNAGHVSVSSLSLLALIATAGLAGFSQLGRSTERAIDGVATSAPEQTLVGSSAQAAAGTVARAGTVVRRFAQGGVEMADAITAWTGVVLARGRARYGQLRGAGFMTKKPSKRGKELIARINGENARTLDSYEERLGEYVAGTPTDVSPSSAQWIAATLERIKGDKSVLEIGSGLGRDADYIEALGFDVLRSDAADSFVQHLRQQGHDARNINVVNDDIAEIAGKQGAVFSNAVLLHLPESELRRALDNMGAALSDEGVLSFAVKRGDGEEWTDAKLGAPRYFRYWEKETLYPILEQHGFDVQWDLSTDRWLHVVARKQANGLGDLTAPEIEQIQAVVDAAGRPLEVVGSAAKGARHSGSDIDYLVPPSSRAHYRGLESGLPEVDLSHGVITGVQNPHIGPAIHFAPGEKPRFVSSAE